MTERIYKVIVSVRKKGCTYVMAESKGQAKRKVIQRGATGTFYEDTSDDTVEILDVLPWEGDENVKVD